ncbi:hypothetical protein ACFXNW_26390 [Nocardia sp. NPDC059180]|uniref:hypothetical protein n=1 Tax=Nocardia sp. NPDC059180 TaxID=3346761 RepID=UPI0036B83703
MRISAAQLAAESDEDRLVVLDHGIIVLDGATALAPAISSAGRYVHVLGGEWRGV